MNTSERLKKGIEDLGLDNSVQQTQLDKFEHYLKLLKKMEFKI